MTYTGDLKMVNISRLTHFLVPLFFGAMIITIVLIGQTYLGEKGEVAALAGFITMFGVSINHVVEGLAYRDREKDKRQFEVRREIYLELAEGISAHWAKLSNLLRFDLDEKAKRNTTSKFLAAGNKLRIVGSAKTVECFEALFKELTFFELDMRQDRRGISTAISEMKQIDEQYKKNQEAMAQINNHLTSMKPTGLFGGWSDGDKQSIANYQEQFSQLNANNIEMSEKRKALYRQAKDAEKVYVTKYIQGVSKMRPLTTELILAIRTELDVTVDEKWFRELSISVDNEIRKVYEQVIERSHQQSVAKLAPANETKPT